MLDLYDDRRRRSARSTSPACSSRCSRAGESLAIIDRGIDEVIDALGNLQSACESEGGAIPGLDLSIAASVDVGGGFGL